MTELLPHQQRVVEEKAALDLKLEALMHFVTTDMGVTSEIFRGLPSDEKGRLRRQAKAMREYSDILGERIAAFTNQDEPMVIFRRTGICTEADPMGQFLSDAAMPVSRIGELGIPPLGRGLVQRLTFMARARLDAEYPDMVRL